MRTVNEVTLLGNVGANPEVKSTSGGTTVASFSVATSYRKEDKTTVTEWHRVVAFRRTAEIVRDYVVKGSAVYLKGQLQTRKYEKDGVTRYTTEVVVRELSLLNNKAADASKAGAMSDRANPEITDDDIPF